MFPRDGVGPHFYMCIILSRTSWPISIKLGANHLWVQGIQVWTNIGQSVLQRGDNHKNAEIGWSHSKIFFSRTAGPG
jgi:hypothetical protein